MFRFAHIARSQVCKLVGSAVILCGLALPAQAASITGLEMALPQPGEGTVSPGLAVRYYFHEFRHIREVISWQDYEDGKVGDPLPSLDYRSGDGPVLTSTASDSVGAHILGFIHLAEAGLYSFATQSNDGVRVSLGGKQIIDDPDVHADRYSDPVEVVIETAGWYPIEVYYFERKVTSTLQLYWLQPDEEEGSMTVVPPEVFAHPKQAN